MMQEMDQSVEGLIGHADMLKSEVDRFKV